MDLVENKCFVPALWVAALRFPTVKEGPVSLCSNCASCQWKVFRSKQLVINSSCQWMVFRCDEHLQAIIPAARGCEELASLLMVCCLQLLHVCNRLQEQASYRPSALVLINKCVSHCPELLFTFFQCCQLIHCAIHQILR